MLCWDLNICKYQKNNVLVLLKYITKEWPWLAIIICHNWSISCQINRIGSLMCGISWVRSPSCQTKDYKIGICCFSTKHAALRRKSKDWLARNQNNVFEWGDMSIRELLFQWASTMKIQLGVLVENKADLIIISLKINFFSPSYSWKMAQLALSNPLTHSS